MITSVARWLMRCRLLLVAGLVAGCGGSTPERVLRIVGPWEFAGIDPAQDAGLVLQHLQILENLVTIDRTGALKPALASRWQAGPDGRTWRFTIRRGVRFHDGTPLTAAIAAADLARAHAGTGVLARVPIQSVTADGEDVVFRLDRPFATLPAFLVNYTAGILAPASFDRAGKVVRIVGTGAFRAESIAPPFRIDMRRFDRWWAGRAGVERATYLSVGRGETRALMALSGSADLTVSVLPVFLERIRRSPDLRLDLVTIPRTRMLKLNAADPKFADIRVRRAISLAIDRRGIAEALFRAPNLAATQLFAPSVTGWHDAALAPLRHDPAAARALLAEAGWRPGADGILRRGGDVFRMEILTYFNWPELPPLATALQAQLRRVGIDARVVVGNSSDIVARHRAGTLSAGLVSRNYAFTPDPLAALLQDFGRDGGDWGASGWSSPRLLQLQERMSGVGASAARVPLQKAAVGILQDELPVIPVVWAEMAVVANKRIVAGRADPFEVNFDIAGVRWAR